MTVLFLFPLPFTLRSLVVLVMTLLAILVVFVLALLLVFLPFLLLLSTLCTPELLPTASPRKS